MFLISHLLYFIGPRRQFVVLKRLCTTSRRVKHLLQTQMSTPSMIQAGYIISFTVKPQLQKQCSNPSASY